MPALLPSLAIAALVVPLLYVYTASVVQTRLPSLRGRRICLLIAHPDDEAMFFAPSVLALTRPSLGNHLKILCLSTGNAAGLGDVRARELSRSANMLGLRGPDDVLVLDTPDFPDSMTQTWDTDKINNLLTSTFTSGSGGASKKSSSSSSSTSRKAAAAAAAPPKTTIDTLITFDAGGVSAHPNHISLYRGARAFASSLARPGWAPPLDLYTLTSVPVWRKYTFFLDALWTLLAVYFGVVVKRGKGGSKGKSASGSASRKGTPEALISMSGLIATGGGGGGSGEGPGSQDAQETYGTARRAMTEAHKSQMVWFRWGWILFSRYMYINDLRRERVDL